MKISRLGNFDASKIVSGVLSRLRVPANVFDVVVAGGAEPVQDRRIIAGLIASPTLVNAAIPTVDALFAFPILTGRSGTLDRLGFNVTTAGAAGSRTRMGLYRADASGWYPGALAVDAGEFVTDVAGIKEAVIAVQKSLGELLFAAIICNALAPQVRSIPANEMFPFGGLSAVYSTTLTCGWRHDPTVYGALPDPYPAGATMQGSATILPALAVRFSA